MGGLSGCKQRKEEEHNQGISFWIDFLPICCLLYPQVFLQQLQRGIENWQVTLPACCSYWERWCLLRKSSLFWMQTNLRSCSLYPGKLGLGKQWQLILFKKKYELPRARLFLPVEAHFFLSPTLWRAVGTEARKVGQGVCAELSLDQLSKDPTKALGQRSTLENAHRFQVSNIIEHIEMWVGRKEVMSSWTVCGLSKLEWHTFCSSQLLDYGYRVARFPKFLRGARNLEFLEKKKRSHF